MTSFKVLPTRVKCLELPKPLLELKKPFGWKVKRLQIIKNEVWSPTAALKEYDDLDNLQRRTPTVKSVS